MIELVQQTIEFRVPDDARVPEQAATGSAIQTGRSEPMRGVLWGVLLSLPFWTILAWALVQ